jgi:hypothetical protein
LKKIQFTKTTLAQKRIFRFFATFCKNMTLQIFKKFEVFLQVFKMAAIFNMAEKLVLRP